VGRSKVREIIASREPKRRKNLFAIATLRSCFVLPSGLMPPMKRRNSFIIIAIVLSAGTGVQISSADAAAFTNGSFELPAIAPNTIVQVPAGSTQIGGWTNHGPGSVDFINGTAGGQQPGPLVGSQYINFNANNTAPGTAVSQTFDTLVGEVYLVNFNVGRGGLAPGDISITASALSNTGQLLASLQGFPPSTIAWNCPASLRFAATTPTTTLRFEDTSINTFDTDVVLDGVSVEPIACTPVTNTVVLTNTVVVTEFVTNIVTQFVTNVVTEVITNIVSLATLRSDVAVSGVAARAIRALTRNIQQAEKNLQKLSEGALRRIGPVNNEVAEKIQSDVRVLTGDAE
jgi:hypothetical protein